MPRIDFWEVSRDPAPRVVALIARQVLALGQRLLVVSADADQRQEIANALWNGPPESFLANGEASAPGKERQPILLSPECEAHNGASHIIFADGLFRDCVGFERTFLLFDEAGKPDARRVWRSLDDREDLERSFYRQDGGKWVKLA